VNPPGLLDCPGIPPGLESLSREEVKPPGLLDCPGIPPIPGIPPGFDALAPNEEVKLPVLFDCPIPDEPPNPGVLPVPGALPVPVREEEKPPGPLDCPGKPPAIDVLPLDVVDLPSPGLELPNEGENPPEETGFPKSGEDPVRDDVNPPGPFD